MSTAIQNRALGSAMALCPLLALWAYCPVRRARLRAKQPVALIHGSLAAYPIRPSTLQLTIDRQPERTLLLVCLVRIVSRTASHPVVNAHQPSVPVHCQEFGLFLNKRAAHELCKFTLAALALARKGRLPFSSYFPFLPFLLDTHHQGFRLAPVTPPSKADKFQNTTCANHGPISCAKVCPALS